MKTTLLMGLLTAALIACSKNGPSDGPATRSPAATHHSEFYSLSVPETATEWWHNAIFYEIWPRSFYDADGDGSGDFNGMTAKLDYLVDLGVNAVWLTPVFEAPSYHGYDFQDFYAVESDYGTMREFENFIAESHRRGIKVILDLVLNHISRDHVWFQKSAAREAGYEDFFLWAQERPQGWGKAWGDQPDPAAVWHWDDTRKAYFYGAFGSSQPDVNLENAQVVAELNRMAEFWLRKGVDGFRLDAVRYAVEEGGIPLQADTESTIDYWSSFSEFVKSIKPDALLVGEAWTGLPTIGKYYNDGLGLDSAFDFDFGYVVIGILNPQIAAAADFGTVTSKQAQNSRHDLWQNLKGRRAAAPLLFFSPFLTNHDQNRLVHSLNGDLEKAKIAASLLLTTPGSVYMYYGEEIGLSQYRTGDDQYRRAIMQWREREDAGFNQTGNFWLDQGQWFPWRENHQSWWADYWQAQLGSGASVEAQAADQNSLYHHYRRLIKVRQSQVALQFPREIRYYPVDNEDVWLVENRHGDARVWVLVNLNADSTSTFTTPQALRGRRTDKLTGADRELRATTTLGPAETLVL